jgi:hypothetical protein
MARKPDADAEADRILETIRQMRLAALYPTRADLEAWIIASKELIEDLPRGPRWDMAAGYLEGMISLYNRRFGDEATMIPPYRPPFSDTPFPGTE